MLLAGFALLAVLFVFAGMIRTPGARKNPYTVIASRALAAAGAILLMRILRHMAIDLIKREKSLKGGIQTKRLKAAWDHSYLLKILSA